MVGLEKYYGVTAEVRFRALVEKLDQIAEPGAPPTQPSPPRLGSLVPQPPLAPPPQQVYPQQPQPVYSPAPQTQHGLPQGFPQLPQPGYAPGQQPPPPSFPLQGVPYTVPPKAPYPQQLPPQQGPYPPQGQSYPPQPPPQAPSPGYGSPHPQQAYPQSGPASPFGPPAWAPQVAVPQFPPREPGLGPAPYQRPGFPQPAPETQPPSPNTAVTATSLRSVPYRGVPAQPQAPPAAIPYPAPRAPKPPPTPTQPPPRPSQPAGRRIPSQTDPWGGSASSLEPDLDLESDIELEVSQVQGRSGVLSRESLEEERRKIVDEALWGSPLQMSEPLPQPSPPTAEPARPGEAETRETAPPAVPETHAEAGIEFEPEAPEIVEPRIEQEQEEPEHLVAGPSGGEETFETREPEQEEAFPQATAPATDFSDEMAGVPPEPAVVSPEDALPVAASDLPSVPHDTEDEEPGSATHGESATAAFDLAQRLSSAESRDDIAEAVLFAAVEKVERAALFIVQADQIIGWAARPRPPAGLRSFSVAFSEPSFFGTLRNSEGFYAGPCPDLAANRLILQSVGAPFPAHITVVPITLKGKSVLFFLGIAPPEAPPPQVVQIRRLGAMTATALEILLLKNRLRNM